MIGAAGNATQSHDAARVHPFCWAAVRPARLGESQPGLTRSLSVEITRAAVCGSVPWRLPSEN